MLCFHAVCFPPSLQYITFPPPSASLHPLCKTGSHLWETSTQAGVMHVSMIDGWEMSVYDLKHKHFNVSAVPPHVKPETHAAAVCYYSLGSQTDPSNMTWVIRCDPTSDVGLCRQGVEPLGIRDRYSHLDSRPCHGIASINEVASGWVLRYQTDLGPATLFRCWKCEWKTVGNPHSRLFSSSSPPHFKRIPTWIPGFTQYGFHWEHSHVLPR